MYMRFFAGALFAGLCAGALAALIQLTFVVPLIVEGELYESGALVHFGAAEPQTHDEVATATTPGAVPLTDLGAPAEPLATAEPGAEPEAEATPAADDGHDAAPAADQATSPLSRHIGTVALFLISYTGFAFLLVAGFALAERAGHVVTARNGAIWGLCGFIALQLAPAFGLPPELPGAQSAPLDARQIWWLICVLATIGGLGLLVFGRNALALGGGAVLLAAPHLVGAPTAPYGGVVPPELAAHFTARVLGAGAICWALLGTIAGAVWARGGQTA